MHLLHGFLPQLFVCQYLLLDYRLSIIIGQQHDQCSCKLYRPTFPQLIIKLIVLVKSKICMYHCFDENLQGRGAL